MLKLRAVEIALALSDLDPRVRSLRTNLLKRDRELREACLFCVGISTRFEMPVWVHPIEESDFDFVASWEADNERHFAPVQLKEVVPNAISPAASIQSIVDGLVRYRSSEQLTVAIHLNQKVRFDSAQVVIPKLSIAALWVFGSIAQDQSEWMLYGNMLEDPAYTVFSYPPEESRS